MLEFLLAQAVTFNHLTDHNYYRVRAMMVNSSPQSSGGVYVTQANINSLLGNPQSCQENSVSLACVWREKVKGRSRVIKISWNKVAQGQPIQTWSAEGF